MKEQQTDTRQQLQALYEGARKTFAQNAYAVTRDKRLVASMTGHSENSQAFNRYSVVSRDVKSSIVDML